MLVLISRQNLNDFKSTSCFTPLAYIYLWAMLIVSVSVYAVDTFTAINLLAFNKWAGQIKPTVPLKYTRWIFAGCIIFSFVMLLYRWLRALKAMRGGKIAKSYLDPLAVRVECIRMGQGHGWKRFLVFAELTKSRKGADYVALFAYYSFEAWLRILIAEGPRVVINAMTLVAYAEANIIPTGEHSAPRGQSPFVQFWKNIGTLAEQDKLQVAIIFGMLWTTLIWLISFLSLAVSIILYLLFLWHHVPSDAGGLSGYCRTKINRRMERIVKTKVDKALKKENEIRARQEAQAFRQGNSDFKRQPTLPDLGSASTPTLPNLSRQTTTTTLPEYTSRPGTAQPNEDALPPMPLSMDHNSVKARPAPPSRHVTSASNASWSSYRSDAPLMGAAGDMGYSPASAQTPGSNVSTPWSARPGPNRNFTGYSEYSDTRSHTPGPPRPQTAQNQWNQPSGIYQMEPLPRPGTAMSQRTRSRDPSNDNPDMMASNSARNMTPTGTSMHAPGFSESSRPGTSMSQRSRNRGYSNDAPEIMPGRTSRTTTPAPGYSAAGYSADVPTLPEIVRPGTGMSNQSRGRGYSNEAPEVMSTGPSRNMTPASGNSMYAQAAPDQQRTRTPGPNFNPYFPPVSPIPEMDGRESPAFGAGPPPRSYTPMGPPPRQMTSGHPTLPRLRTPSNGGNEGSYMAYNPNRGITPQPTTYTNQTYQSYQGYQTQSPTSIEPPNHSFNHSYQSNSGRSTPQNNNLQPPGLYPADRAGSFDDILDHY